MSREIRDLSTPPSPAPKVNGRPDNETGKVTIATRGGKAQAVIWDIVIVGNCIMAP
ncbi:hypothetical protein BaRGS_00003723, partial [Batillaria attramentaria]